MALTVVRLRRSVIDHEHNANLDLLFLPIHVPVHDRLDEYHEPLWPSEENLKIIPLLGTVVTPVVPVRATGKEHLFSRLPSTVRLTPVGNFPFHH